MVFHSSLSDSKSPQVSRTLLSILAVLNNSVVWMVSTCPPTAMSSGPFSNPYVTFPNAPITIGIFIIIIIYSLEFFTSALADGFLQESEWQQVSSSPQDPSQFSSRSQ